MTAPALRDVQRWMKSRIRPGAEALPGGPVLNPQRGVPGQERLAVYADGYIARVLEALEDVYPAVRRLCGARRFGELAAAYAADRPSRHYNLNAMGEALPEWLAQSAAITALPFLADLARLERAIARAFHAPLLPSGAGRLAAAPPTRWPGLRIVFQPAVAVCASAWPILELWAARTQPPGTINLQVEDRPQRVLVFRDGLQVRCELLPAPWAAVLAALLDGRSLGDALEVADGSAPPAEAEALFARWAAAGLIVDVVEAGQGRDAGGA